MKVWKEQANESWTPTYGDLRAPEKPRLHKALIEEQGAVCCYCGQRIGFEDSHVEHFRPQEHFQALQLDYANLHASCIRQTLPGRPLHCGHAKGSDFDNDLAISPLDVCEARFTYTLDGQIEATDVNDPKASYMVRLLKLDVSLLENLRRQALLGVFSEDFVLTASPEELRRVAQAFREPESESRRLPNLGHVVARYSEQLMS